MTVAASESTSSVNPWGGCECPRTHYCGHCMENGTRKTVLQENPFCFEHGVLTGKDVVTAYPEGHNHA